jgi:hypothetical protein
MIQRLAETKIITDFAKSVILPPPQRCRRRREKIITDFAKSEILPADYDSSDQPH